VAIKAILIMGLLAFLLLWGGSIALRKTVTPNEAERVANRAAQSPFDGNRALNAVKTLTSGSMAPSDFVTQRLRSPGFSVQRLDIEQDGEERTHLIARRTGPMPGHILLVTPYTPAQPGLPGAIASASGAALLLELATVLPRDWTQHTVWLVFLDGVYAPGDDAMAGLLNAAEAADDWKRGPTAALYVAGVGDCYLAMSRDRDAPKALVDILWGTAHRFLLNPHFRDALVETGGPAAALRARGIAAAALADQVHGGSLAEHERLWQTPADTPDRVCAESLQALGDVLYHGIPAMDGYLNGMQGTR
jgi:hypothetical protein